MIWYVKTFLFRFRRRRHRFARRHPRRSDSFFCCRTFPRAHPSSSHVGRRAPVGHSRRRHGPPHQRKDRRTVRTPSQRPRRTSRVVVERNVDAFETFRSISSNRSRLSRTVGTFREVPIYACQHARPIPKVSQTIRSTFKGCESRDLLVKLPHFSFRIIVPYSICLI